MKNRETTIDRSTVWLISLITLNVAFFVASNAAGAKMIAVWGGLAASATVFSYAFTFVITDAISELFGKQMAKLAVRLALVGGLLSVLVYILAIAAPSASFWEQQDSYKAVLGHAPRILLGGFLAYTVSQHLDVWLFHKMKALTGEKHLWLRNNGSTLISQLIDSVIFMTIAFYGVFPLFEAIIGQYLIKLVIALFDTPIVYLIVHLYKKHTGQSV